MNQITTLAIDLAKTVFQLHGVDGRGVAVLRRQLRRAQLLSFIAQLSPCLVAMEACGGAHHWGREITRLGHRVKLIPPQYVKPFVKGNKTDRNDAEAICEAALRPRMPEVAVKSVEQQGLLAIHRMRQLLDKQRKQLGNQLRGLLLELGIAIPCGVAALRRAIPEVIEGVTPSLRPSLRQAWERLLELEDAYATHTRQIEQYAKDNALCRRLMQERGVGPMIASAYIATVGDPARFRNGRQVSASLGIVPRQHSTGGKPLLLGISKRGDGYLRMLLIHGARAVMSHVPGQEDALSRWLQQLAHRRGVNRASVALANKTARRLWAIWRAEGAALAIAA
ncbi:MAG TPA: IS110 family transposase [Steroidobacteraceae bacterium]|nr:IS110 family transposase [Steroidobacteraceae bacterium]